MTDLKVLKRQLDDFFNELNHFAPASEADFTMTAIDEAWGISQDVIETEIADSPSNIQQVSGILPASGLSTGPAVPDVVLFTTKESALRRPIAAVDAGMMRLGESANGIVIALRGAILVRDGKRSVTGLVRSGPIYLGWEHEAELLLLLGQWLGDPGYYIVAERGDDGVYRTGRLKDGVGGRKYLADRFRAGLERWCQRLAATSIGGGTLLLDGSLTLRSRDTPDIFMNQIAYLAGREGNSVVGLSKKSELVVGGRAVTYWLDDQPAIPCHRALTPILRWEDAQVTARRGGRADRVMGNVYAARFSSLGPTYRMDVKAAPNMEDDIAIDHFFESVDIFCGYPSFLARAHAACYISSADFLSLQVQATREFGLRPQRRMPLTGAFAPFQGSFK